MSGVRGANTGLCTILCAPNRSELYFCLIVLLYKCLPFGGYIEKNCRRSKLEIQFDLPYVVRCKFQVISGSWHVVTAQHEECSFSVAWTFSDKMYLLFLHETITTIYLRYDCHTFQCGKSIWIDELNTIIFFKNTFLHINYKVLELLK